MKGSIAFMKQTVMCTITVLAIIIGGGNGAHAQEWDHEYVPFVEEGKVWNCISVTSPDTDEGTVNCIFTMSGDTIIGENLYKKVVCLHEDYYGDKDQHYYCAVREEAYRVFVVGAGAKEERPIYDFSYPQEIVILIYDEHDLTRASGYHNTFFPTKQLSFPVYYGEQIDYRYFRGDWIEGVGIYTGNPFVGGLHFNEPDQLFDHPIVVVSCINGDKVLFELEWMEEPASLKEMISNKTTEGGLYDIQGRRVKGTPKKGVYIQNGKAVVIK